MEHFWVSCGCLLPASAAPTPQPRQASSPSRNQSPAPERNVKSETLSHPHAPSDPTPFCSQHLPNYCPNPILHPRHGALPSPPAPAPAPPSHGREGLFSSQLDADTRKHLKFGTLIFVMIQIQPWLQNFLKLSRSYHELPGQGKRQPCPAECSSHGHRWGKGRRAGTVNRN